MIALRKWFPIDMIINFYTEETKRIVLTALDTYTWTDYHFFVKAAFCVYFEGFFILKY